MKITLMEAVMANLAAEEGRAAGRPLLPGSGLMKVKQATAAEAETFAAEERKLVEKFAAKDEDGNIRVAQGDSPSAPRRAGRIRGAAPTACRDAGRDPFYEAAGAGAGHDLRKSLEVLSRFIDFRGGDRK